MMYGGWEKNKEINLISAESHHCSLQAKIPEKEENQPNPIKSVKKPNQKRNQKRKGGNFEQQQSTSVSLADFS